MELRSRASNILPIFGSLLGRNGDNQIDSIYDTRTMKKGNAIKPKGWLEHVFFPLNKLSVVLLVVHEKVDLKQQTNADELGKKGKTAEQLIEE